MRPLDAPPRRRRGAPRGKELSDERRRELEEERAEELLYDPDRLKAEREAKLAKRRGGKEPKPKKDRIIVGVDGEGQDTYTCKRCGLFNPAWDDLTCPTGEEHDLEPDGGHIYTYLAAVDENGSVVAERFNRNGLTHEECVGCLLAIGKRYLPFAFMFSYDSTKIFEELPLPLLFRLMRPRTREAKKCLDKDCGEKNPRSAKRCKRCFGDRLRPYTRSVRYGRASYDYFNGSVSVGVRLTKLDNSVEERKTKVWDGFRFFGTSFVEALKDWSPCTLMMPDGSGEACGASGKHRKETLEDGSVVYRCGRCKQVAVGKEQEPVATEEEIAQVFAMKQKRGRFDRESPEDIARYCQLECFLFARMMRKVVDAHEKAGIPLTRYDGAGSSASALLRANDVADFRGPPLRKLPIGLAVAIASAFSGGRFENSVVGLVPRMVYGYDISSAYPFALTHLPCLACGRWSLTERGMTLARVKKIVKAGGLVVAHFRVKQPTEEQRRSLAWAPLPFRSEDGSITYGVNFKGWAWAPELIEALEGWPDLVELTGPAWVYEKRCDHQPFKFIPRVYRQRIEWGKEGAGKALKLGANACVAEGTLVATDEGEIPIERLVGAAARVLGWDGAYRFVADAVRVGRRDTLRVVTCGGRELVATPDHLVQLLGEGDVRVSELEPGDVLVTLEGADAVARVESGGERVVYDLSEPETQHFFAGGILAHNCYGKLAQSLGDDPPFQQWVWAGMTTSTTRGQLLSAMREAEDLWSILAVATDGILSLEELDIETSPVRKREPIRDTGTSDLKKPLGGWELKEVPEGIFTAKPGLYYSLEKKFVRARGVGRREIMEQSQELQAAFAAWNRRDPDFGVTVKSRRFYGAKSSVYGRAGCKPCGVSWAGVPEVTCPVSRERAKETGKEEDLHPGTWFQPSLQKRRDGRPGYGTWDERDVKIGFDPFPKRERDTIELGGPFARLHVRDLGGETSRPYPIGLGRTSPEGEAARAAQDEAMEQGDWDDGFDLGEG